MNINQILKSRPRNCSRGAPLGDHGPSEYQDGPMYCQKVHLDSGGYAPDGTYWGRGEAIYCAFNGGSAPAMGFRQYVRASSRNMAVFKLHQVWPYLTFKRTPP